MKYTHTLPVAATLICATLLLPASVSARTHRVPQIPHGDRWGCTSCHRNMGGGGDFTPFGSDTILALVGAELLQERDVDWSAVYDLDSDRDGFTNGEELNDPMGMWRIGDRDPVGGVVYNPGDSGSHPLATCGDGRVTPPEGCDGTNFRSQTCIGLGLDEGVLACNPDCTFDTSRCGGGEVTIQPDMGILETPDDVPAEDAACSSASANGQGGLAALLLVLLGMVYRRTRRREDIGLALGSTARDRVASPPRIPTRSELRP